VPDLDLELDLDSARGARNEEKPKTIRLGGKVIDLPKQLPMEVLEPLLDVDADLSMLLRSALDARQASDDAMAVASAVIDMVVVNPRLPQQLIAAVKEMAKRLVGESYAVLVEAKLTLPEAASIAKFVFKVYGVSLGEASPSSDSAAGEGSGETSNQTSAASADSAQPESGSAPETQAS
jgi:hypothetical protein